MNPLNDKDKNELFAFEYFPFEGPKTGDSWTSPTNHIEILINKGTSNQRIQTFSPKSIFEIELRKTAFGEELDEIKKDFNEQSLNQAILKGEKFLSKYNKKTGAPIEELKWLLVVSREKLAKIDGEIIPVLNQVPIPLKLTSRSAAN